MTSLISNPTQVPSPFRFDSSPSGEADVDPDQIAVLESRGAKSDGWGSDGFDFKDVLDIINPLQHIPVISSIYRAVTGDEIAAAPRAIGGAVYGGPVGLLAAVGNNIFEAETGSDIGETTIAALSGFPGGFQGGSPGGSPGGPQGEPQDVGGKSPINPTPVPPTPQLASVPATAIEAPARETLIQQYAKTPPAVSSGFIPSDAAARAGLFGAPVQPLPISAPKTQAPDVRSTGNQSNALQSAPGNALDRLIARSRAAQAERSGIPSQETLQVPTGSDDVHGWMLRALGKYETMPKG